MQTPSKQIPIRLPQTIYDELRQEAQRRHTSMTQVVIQALDQVLANHRCPTCHGTGEAPQQRPVMTPFGEIDLDWQRQVGS